MPVIYHRPKYDPPFYFDPRLDNLGWLERAEIIALCFEKARWKHLDSLRKKCVEWCKPVLLTAKWRTSKDIDPLNDNEDSDEEKEEVEREVKISIGKFFSEYIECPALACVVILEKKIVLVPFKNF